MAEIHRGTNASVGMSKQVGKLLEPSQFLCQFRLDLANV